MSDGSIEQAFLERALDAAPFNGQKWGLCVKCGYRWHPVKAPHLDAREMEEAMSFPVYRRLFHAYVTMAAFAGYCRYYGLVKEKK